MSEFKFACPVCGQHITADSSASGGKLECPTCFQKIIVPQAPSNPDAKFIISATQVGKPRPTSIAEAEQAPPPGLSAGKKSLIATVAFLIVLCGAGGAAFAFRDKLFRSGNSAQNANGTNSIAKKKGPPPKVYPIPTNLVWSLDLGKIVMPDATAVGKIHGSGFYCEKAILQGGHLTLRQGSSGAADLGVTIQFFAQLGEELSGKNIEVAADRQPPLPKVIVRWKDENQKAMTYSLPNGYALKVSFGEADSGRMPGKLYLALPDDQKSVVAGSFNAEIRRPPPPKPQTPKPAKPKKVTG